MIIVNHNLMFQKESCHPRDTATLLFNSEKISASLASLKFLVATTFFVLTQGKKTLTSGHNLQSAEDMGSILAAGVRVQSGEVNFGQVLRLKALLQHLPGFTWAHLSYSCAQVKRTAHHGVNNQEITIL